MAAPGTIRALVSRRPLGAWLLVLFLLAQLAPIAALAATESMAGMACCKHGHDSCCRRKPMRAAPAFRAGHPCGMSCAGTPTVAGHDPGTVVAPLAIVAAVFVELPAAEARLARLAKGYDAALFQRPPPVFVSSFAVCS